MTETKTAPIDIVKKPKRVKKPRAVKVGGVPKKQNAWVMFVKNHRVQHPELSYRQAMTACKAIYKKDITAV